MASCGGSSPSPWVHFPSNDPFERSLAFAPQGLPSSSDTACQCPCHVSSSRPSSPLLVPQGSLPSPGAGSSPSPHPNSHPSGPSIGSLICGPMVCCHHLGQAHHLCHTSTCHPWVLLTDLLPCVCATERPRGLIFHNAIRLSTVWRLATDRPSRGPSICHKALVAQKCDDIAMAITAKGPQPRQ